MVHWLLVTAGSSKVYLQLLPEKAPQSTIWGASRKWFQAVSWWPRVNEVSPWSKQQLCRVPMTPPLLTAEVWYWVKANNLCSTHLQHMDVQNSVYHTGSMKAFTFCASKATISSSVCSINGSWFRFVDGRGQKVSHAYLAIFAFTTALIQFNKPVKVTV